MMIRKVFALLAACALLLTGAPCAALAEGSFVIDVDSLNMDSLRDDAYLQQNLCSAEAGVRVTKYISDSNELAARVRLTIQQAGDATIIFDKNYGYQSGSFDSGDIYLPYADSGTLPYIITLAVEDWTYAFPFLHAQPRLNRNSGCTWGVRMRDYCGVTDNWVMGTMLNLDELRQSGWRTLPLCASNLYVVGQATVSLSGDQLTVGLAFADSAHVELLGSAVYLIGDVTTVVSADPGSMPQPAYGVGQPIDVSGLRTALLYVPLSLSYDPAGLSQFSYDLYGDAELQSELALWNENAAQAWTQPAATEEPMPDWQEPQPAEAWTEQPAQGWEEQTEPQPDDAPPAEESWDAELNG